MPAPSDTTDVTSQVSITRSGFRLDRALNEYVQTVTITNTSGRAIPEPLSLVFDHASFAPTFGFFGLTPDALLSANGVLSDGTSVSPYVNVYDISGNSLLPGQNVSETLYFDRFQVNGGISYDARVLIPNAATNGLAFTVNGGPLTPINSLQPLDVGTFFDDGIASSVTITNVSNHNITLDGALPSDTGADTFGYRAVSSNFRFADSNGTVFTVGAAANGGVFFVNATDTNFKVLAPGETVQFNATTGVTGVVRGVATAGKSTTAFPVTGGNGREASIALTGPNGSQFIFQHGEVIPPIVNVGNIQVGSSITLKLQVYNPSSSTASVISIAPSGGKYYTSAGSVKGTAPSATAVVALLRGGPATTSRQTYTITLTMTAPATAAVGSAISGSITFLADGVAHGSTGIDPYSINLTGTVVAAKKASPQAIVASKPVRPTASSNTTDSLSTRDRAAALFAEARWKWERYLG